MDGKGAWRDNVFVERLWRRNRKYEEVGYRRAYKSGRDGAVDLPVDLHMVGSWGLGPEARTMHGRAAFEPFDSLSPDRGYFTQPPFRSAA